MSAIDLSGIGKQKKTLPNEQFAALLADRLTFLLTHDIAPTEEQVEWVRARLYHIFHVQQAPEEDPS